jgi:hypothetical protein
MDEERDGYDCEVSERRRGLSFGAEAFATTAITGCGNGHASSVHDKEVADEPGYARALACEARKAKDRPEGQPGASQASAPSRDCRTGGAGPLAEWYAPADART